MATLNTTRRDNIARLKKQLMQMKKWKVDLIIILTRNSCEICKIYNHKIFSVSGKSKKYPKLPNEFLNDGGFCDDCNVGVNTFFEGISSKR